MSIIALIIGITLIIYFLLINLHFGKVSFSINLFILGLILILYYYNKDFLINTTIFKILYPFLILLFILFIILEIFIIYFSLSKNVLHCDYVLILGAGLKNNKPSKTLQYRLDSAIYYVNNYNNECKIILSGGVGYNETISESLAMKTYLINSGIDEKRLILEEESKNTFENLKYSKIKILNYNNNFSKVKIKIVTSDFHCFRTYILSKKNNYKNVTFYNSDSNILLKPNYFTREFFAIVKSILFY
ncbi:YdcF family protein [Clostridium sp. CTA-19]